MGKERNPDLRGRMFDFACSVVTFSRRLSREPGVVREIAWQLAAAATSAGANIEEAKAALQSRPHDRRRTAPQGGELTAMLTAGMKHLNPVDEEADSKQFRVLSSKFSVLSSSRDLLELLEMVDLVSG